MWLYVGISLLSFVLLIPTNLKKHKIYFCKTFHCRFQPVKHRFAYPLFYIGLRLDKPFNFNRFGILSVYDQDYLSVLKKGRTSIADKLYDHLDDLGLEYDYAELVTTPRFFGYSFNPLTMYYLYQNAHASNKDTHVDSSTSHHDQCKDTHDKLVGILLEVNNTFGEKHLYFCDERSRLSESKVGFTHSYLINRGFHVSPFNNRSGVYECHFEKSQDWMNVLLHVKRYVPDTLNTCNTDNTDSSTTSSEKVHFTAGVKGHATPITYWTLLYLITVYPLNCLLTVPRILYEAYRLTYGHGLLVFTRPNPNTGHGDGKTIWIKEMTPLQSFYKDLVFKYLDDEKEFVLRFPDGTVSTVGRCGKELGEITIRSFGYYNWYAIYNTNCVFALFMAVVRGDLLADRKTLFEFAKAHAKSNTIEPFLHPKKIKILDSVVQLGLGDRFKIWSGVLQVKMELWMFKKSAEFAKGYDPWNLEKRCLDYLSNVPTVDYDWDGLQDLPDTLSGINRERIRARHFLESIKCGS